MATYKRLDETGLARVWAKVKAYVAEAVDDLSQLIDNKQNTLTAGTGIGIANDVISATGNVPQLTIGSHNSQVGSALSAVAAAKTLASGTHTMITSITLPAGSWVVYCGVRFPANASGRRQANLSVTSGSNSSDWVTTPVNGAVTQFAFTKLISHTVAQTFYLNVYQNSGSSLSMPAGSASNYNCIYAVRIA